ncbi:MAG: flagellin FliC, partial [Anaeromyxobacteraceae bacterium]|nr:flagellin FliC [Anaeromyxobacteraceae bacterium]
MSLSIRTNVSSLNAQRNLSSTQLHLDSSLSRLSSGFRITRAGDDAAGLGISSKLESQIRSYTQATRNANDGLSVVQSTEAALNEQANILTRMRELAMQSASDGVGNVERGYIDKESTKLLAELQRISQVAEYNGTKLLDGSAATLDFQVGIAATANDVISLTTLNGT